jgi:hypothetical protein
VYEGNERFTVTLSAPANAIISQGTATVTISDDDVIPTLSAVAAPNPIVENAGDVTVTLTLSAASALDTLVNYATSSGTAASVADFTPTSGTATIPAGQTSTTFTVTVVNDAASELTEQFFVNLSAPVNAVLSAAQVTVIINDDEDTDGDGVPNLSDPYPNNRPTLTVNNASARQHNTQTRDMLFTFTLNYPNPGQAYSANWATVNGSGGSGAMGGATCASPADFITQSSTVSFAAGSANGATSNVTITVCPKSGTEGPETFTIALSNPSPATTTLGSVGTGTINP